MKSKKILAILGGPHTNGITGSMLDCAIRSSEGAEYEISRINLYEKQLGFCKGCRACIRTGVCIQKDGLQEIASLMKECDMVILAAPIYWANVPACVKNMFDRLLGTAIEETNTFPKPRLPGKKYVVLTACNAPFPFSWICGQSRYAIRSMDEFFKAAGMSCAGRVVCTNAAKRKGKELSEALVRKIDRCIV
ncbi:multimeric flavodoxin WrbA [Kineothrix alysoides]|uniref:Multimeric flavodoxin WrbA n=1 Tax=Kineothrix alysoides TaxID=1469948 RepID=A0A4V2QBT8_9FIRM|nr:flavodoxin family protein [Kineothrix alysoides]TCL57692.1 multimeric flavodoxin WrbA [Kineothrix alysoides]